MHVIYPDPGVVRGYCVDAIFLPAECGDGLFEQANVGARGEVVPFEVDDGICDELTGPVEGGLAAAEGFIEGGLAVGSRLSEILCLVLRDIADFAAAACVDGVELCRDNGRRWGGAGGGGGVGFVGEEVGDEAVLESRGVGVGRQAGEMEVANDRGHFLIECIPILTFYKVSGEGTSRCTVRAEFSPGRASILVDLHKLAISWGQQSNVFLTTTWRFTMSSTNKPKLPRLPHSKPTQPPTCSIADQTRQMPKSPNARFFAPLFHHPTPAPNPKK